MSAAVEGVRALIRYTDHLGREGPRQVVITGRVATGPTPWHPDAAWTFEVWDRKAEAFQMFDPRGVAVEPAELLGLILVAAEARERLQARELASARGEARASGEQAAYWRTRSTALGGRLADARRELRHALCSSAALERRRDELLEAANRYLARARRLRASLYAYRRRVLAAEGTDMLGMWDREEADVTEDDLVAELSDGA